MSNKQDAIREIYAKVSAPQWAAANLDALVDVLRDLSWLPAGPVVVALPDVTGLEDAERADFLRVLREIAVETADSERPVRWVIEY